MTKTIAFDFDGVLHSYVNGWTGEIPTDPPVPGAQEAVRAFVVSGYRVVVFTCRGLTEAGRAATSAWLKAHDFPAGLEVTGVKPHAELYVDDRAYRFTGSWAELLEAVEARKIPAPWTTPRRNCVPWGSIAMPSCGACGAEVNEVRPDGTYAACGHPVPNIVSLATCASLIGAEIKKLRDACPPHELECTCEDCLRWLIRRGDLAEELSGMGFEDGLAAIREARLAQSLLADRARGGAPCSS